MKKAQPVIWFWILATLLLFWSLADFMVFLTKAFTPDKVTATMNDTQIATYNARPFWYIYAVGISVIAGIMAAASLLWRKKIAVPLAFISFAAVLFTMGYTLSKGSLGVDNIYNGNLVIMILFFDLTLVFLALYAKKKSWIN